uniref:kinase-interacting protein 1-like n=1 Tax=Erigeron canadensis TaxID=72917 RepID=UPI001CB9A7EB|nr:kinase-interacting protein 1-like [Erigeron canadensis]
MLSRAARNAYSWWWASHIRTKQSKWLDQNLQDMEEKVEYILKIITEDGDSFRTRAEQYYRKRPELVNFVEDTFRGYRSLAERYDHLSRDLQSANRTIASVFPEKVQMSFDEDDYEDFTSNLDEDEMKIPTNSNVPLPLPMPPKRNHNPKMENVVQAMIKQKSKMPTKMMSKRGLIKIGVDEKTSRPVSKSSGLSKDEALEEINKLQKDILGFQTEKEFVKSSYENTLSKYWEIENSINEMHVKISDLQHEFGAGAMIEDKDAQTLMSSSALKMCKETLIKMKNNHKRFRKEAIVQHKKADEIRKTYEALIASNKSKSDFEETMEHVKDKKAKIEKKDMNAQMESTESQTMNQKEDEDIKDRESRIKEGILGKDEPITISKVAEKIEQLVDKIINLETDVISQAALIMRLKFENDELLEQLQSLENEKMRVEDSSDMSINFKRLEERLEIVQILDHKVKGQNSNLEASFDEVSTSLDSLSNDVLIAKPDENIQEDVTFHDGKEGKSEFSNVENENGFGSYKIHHSEEKAVEENKIKDNDEPEDFVDQSTKNDEVNVVESRDINIEGGHHQEFFETTINNYKDVDFISEHGEPNWKLLLSLEIEDREEMLLKEYTSTLKIYKEVKRKLNETEKRNRANSFRSAVQMKMLKKSNESKDSEIRSLYEKLKLLERKMEKSINFEVKKASNLVNIEETEGRTTLYEIKENNKDFEEATNLIDETTQGEDELDDIEYELRKASDAIDEGTHRIKELIENAHSELKKAQGLVEGGTQKRKDQLGETTTNEPTKSPNMVDETTDFELEKDQKNIDKETQRIEGSADIATDFEHKKSIDLVDEETQRRRKLGDRIGEAHEVLDIEDEIRTEIDDLRKENLELWLRFSTSYHQINRFQDSYNDLLQEIKDVKEKKHKHDHKHHQHQHSHYVSSDVRPLYRQLRDMHTEVILWLEKSGILEDDLQHRLTSFSDIQNEISGISTSEYSNAEKAITTPLGEHQAAKFQGEVLNMKQENANVLDELRVASERVRKLQVDLERTLSELEAELGKVKKSDSSLKVPFKSFLFGAKLKRKRRSSLFKCMSPSLRRHRSSDIKQPPSPQPKEDNV